MQAAFAILGPRDGSQVVPVVLGGKSVAFPQFQRVLKTSFVLGQLQAVLASPPLQVSSSPSFNMDKRHHSTPSIYFSPAFASISTAEQSSGTF
jgi:hypothetical protein